MAKAKSGGSQNEPGKKKFVFNVEKDTLLLKCSLQHNPWQLGNDKWTVILKEMEEIHNWKITERTLKDRVALLVQKYEKQELSITTGTEQQRTERSFLLKEIKMIIEESNAKIITEFGADDEAETGVSDSEEVASVKLTKPKKGGQEEADKERNNAFKTFCDESVPEPLPRKKRKLSPEDELIKAKQEHDMKMDEEKLRFEEKKLKNNVNLEEKRIELEKTKLQLEYKREERLADENKRRDELSSSQLLLQTQMLQVLSSLVRKN